MVAAPDPGRSRILSSRLLSNDDAKWVRMRAITWVDPTGRERQWESTERSTRKGDADGRCALLMTAVAIFTVIKRPSSEPHTLLVRQFRPPVGSCVIELPAGLIDEGEDGKDGATRAALRELREETGYRDEPGHSKVTVQTVTPITHNDPGMSTANMRLCVVEIQLSDDAPEPVAEPDEGEFIEKHLVPLRGLRSKLEGALFYF